jgi:hypothetical protein
VKISALSPIVIVLALCQAPLLPAQNNAGVSGEALLRRALQTKTGAAALPGGIVEISREIVLPADAHDLEIRGSTAPGNTTTLRASAAFRGRALIVLPAGKNIKIHDLALDGNRDAFAQPVNPAPAGAMLSRVVANNGILAEGVTGLDIAQVKAARFAGFPILINGGGNIHVHDVELTESGSLDSGGHNNGSGGILLEEGVTDFEVLHSLIGKIRGNGVWVRSTGNSIATRGRIADTEFAIVARAAIELNHAATIVMEHNIVHMIGFPGEETLVGGTNLPSGIATTGSVDRSSIRNNTFVQIAGRCLSLDGFSNGEVTGNECSDQLFNAFLIRGTGNRITGNHLTGLNSAHKDQPESLRAGIYLAGGSSANTLDANEITGYGMGQHCIGGPALSANTIVKNSCSDEASVARLQPAIRH